MAKGASGDVARGRRAFERGAWLDAHRALARADAVAPLPAAALELLATAALLTGRDDEGLAAFERAHQSHIDAGDVPRAVRCAFWAGLRRVARSELGPAMGWFARAGRLLERHGDECVEQGWLLVPVAHQHLAARDLEAALTAAARAVEISGRFGDEDLAALAGHLEGRALLRRGELTRGLERLDEAMVAAVAGRLSPLVTGMVYCSVIDDCRQIYALDRAREWTAALTRWCDSQPTLVAFTGACLVHRAEVLRMGGAWDEALAEARRAAARLSLAHDRQDLAHAHYEQGELHRLRGRVREAEAAYRAASEGGWEPQPGLALLRLAEGRVAAAAAAMRRVVAATTGRLERARLLPAHVEILLAAGEVATAGEAATELGETTAVYGTPALRAMAAEARGAVALAAGETTEAMTALRRAWRAWVQVEAPREAARVRARMALACRALGDDDGARLELDAAAGVLAALGAEPDVRWVASLRGAGGRDRPVLSPRERQVLRLVADGQTNRAIAAELSLSEKTVDRHVSNILTKLDAPSRAAATARAYERKLL